jgi:hypothetical protein
MFCKHDNFKSTCHLCENEHKQRHEPKPRIAYLNHPRPVDNHNPVIVNHNPVIVNHNPVIVNRNLVIVNHNPVIVNRNPNVVIINPNPIVVDPVRQFMIGKPVFGVRL